MKLSICIVLRYANVLWLKPCAKWMNINVILKCHSYTRLQPAARGHEEAETHGYKSLSWAREWGVTDDHSCHSRESLMSSVWLLLFTSLTDKLHEDVSLVYEGTPHVADVMKGGLYLMVWWQYKLISFQNNGNLHNYFNQSGKDCLYRRVFFSIK